MVTLAIVVCIMALILLGVALMVIFGGVTGLAIIVDLIIAFAIIGLLGKLLFGK